MIFESGKCPFCDKVFRVNEPTVFYISWHLRRHEQFKVLAALAEDDVIYFPELGVRTMHMQPTNSSGPR